MEIFCPPTDCISMSIILINFSNDRLARGNRLYIPEAVLQIKPYWTMSRCDGMTASFGGSKAMGTKIWLLLKRGYCDLEHENGMGSRTFSVWIDLKGVKGLDILVDRHLSCIVVSKMMITSWFWLVVMCTFQNRNFFVFKELSVWAWETSFLR